MKNVTENQDVINELSKFNLWGKSGRDSEFLFTGTYDECSSELEENYDKNHPDYSIVKNEIADQWENEVEGIGYVKMANNELIEYSL